MAPPDRPTPTHLLVGNPTAQSGKNAARIAHALQLFAQAGVLCDELHTAPAGRTIELVREALLRTPYRCVISMGGDGTFREVASGLLLSGKAEEIPLGMLPTGTANDQGRSFGLRSDEDSLETNVQVVCAGHETRLDAGQITALGEQDQVIAEAFFFDSAGWGLSARILADRNHDRELVAKVPGLRHLYRDQMVYAGATLKNFAESYVIRDKFVAHIESDGQTRTLTKLSDLIIKATRVYGGAWVFDPSSRHDDGLFEIVPARGRRDWASRVIHALDRSPIPTEALEAIGIEPSEISRVSSLTLTIEPPRHGAFIAAQIDGEEFPATRRTRVRVLPRAIRLLVPRSP
jgi:diacylglycerol kinase family enzyme